MRSFARLVVTLTAIAGVASFGLSAVYNATHGIAEEYKRLEEENARREVLPGAETAVFEETETDTIVNGRRFVYVVARGPDDPDNVIGYAFTAYGKGYSSTIETVVGVDLSGTVSGIKIVFQQETPGLGAKVEEIASENTLWDVMKGQAKDESGLRPWFQVQFEGKGMDDLHVVKTAGEKGVLAITGATISSESVTESVKRGLSALHEILGMSGQAGGSGMEDSGGLGGGEGEGAEGLGGTERGAAPAAGEEIIE